MDIQLTKIEIETARRYGPMKKMVPIPIVYSRDNKIETDDPIEIFRGIINGQDSLVIRPSKSNGKHTTNPSSKSQES